MRKVAFSDSMRGQGKMAGMTWPLSVRLSSLAEGCEEVPKKRVTSESWGRVFINECGAWEPGNAASNGIRTAIAQRPMLCGFISAGR
jgi:hypothetical protein